MKMLKPSGSILIFLLISLLLGCRDAGVVRRPGEPDFVEAFDESRMDAAIAEAKSTISEFVAALEDRSGTFENFAIKKGFDYGAEGEREFMWINEVRLVDDGFQGRVNNEPVYEVGVVLGETVLVSPDEVADWMYLDGGKLRGGFTIVALVFGTSEQREYEENMGIDWSNYKFLKIGK